MRTLSSDFVINIKLDMELENIGLELVMADFYATTSSYVVSLCIFIPPLFYSFRIDNLRKLGKFVYVGYTGDPYFPGVIILYI